MDNVRIVLDPKPKATIGLVEVPSDMVVEMEAGGVLSQIPDVLWRFNKMRFADGDEEINEGTYTRAAGNIAEAAHAFLPSEANTYGSLDVIALSCTSLSFTLGTEKVQSELLNGYPAALRATDMATSVIDAIHQVVCWQDGGNAKESGYTIAQPRVVLLTPYIDSIHAKNIKFLENSGIKVVQSHNLGFTSDKETSAVQPASIAECCKALASIDSDGIDAIFIGCSAFRSTGFGFIDELESSVNKPVITSNQALLWKCLTLCNKVTEKEIQSIKGYGQLFAVTNNLSALGDLR